MAPETKKSRAKANKRRLASKNREYLRSYKETHSCEMCGESRAVCLDFHHRDRSEKRFELARAPEMAFFRVLAEVRKCMVLCANCHRVLHGNEHLEQIAAVPVEDFPLFDALKEVV